jgi:hypothetical protein
MSNSSDQPLIPTYQCRDCGNEVGFRSRRRTFTERFLLPLFLLQPVRCGECFRRDYRLIFTPVRDRLSDTGRSVLTGAVAVTPEATTPSVVSSGAISPGAARMMPGKHPATSDRNVA